MHENNLLIHVANVQYSQGIVLAGVAKAVEKLLKNNDGTVDPALAQAIQESKVHTDALRKALDENS